MSVWLGKFEPSLVYLRNPCENSLHNLISKPIYTSGWLQLIEKKNQKAKKIEKKKLIFKSLFFDVIWSKYYKIFRGCSGIIF